MRTILRGAVSTALGIAIVALSLWGWHQYRDYQHAQSVQSSTSCPQVPEPLYNNGTDCP